MEGRRQRKKSLAWKKTNSNYEKKIAIMQSAQYKIDLGQHAQNLILIIYICVIRILEGKKRVGLKTPQNWQKT